MRSGNEEARKNRRGCLITLIVFLLVVLLLGLISLRSRDRQTMVETMSNMLGGGTTR